jgi:ABC-type Fe3+/spermidine/putrescine transport system ATPase subunit
MLEVRNLEVELGGTSILRGADLTVPRDSTVALLGPSGSGKSTLLRAVAGLVPVRSGSVIWDGTEVTAVPTHRRGFGLMFQGFALFPHLDVAGNVGFGLEEAKRSDRVAAALAMVDLAGFQSRQIADLSGGERQRVALARTLAPRPELVMLDEPFGSLDRNLRDKVIADTKRLLATTGSTALVVTHDRDEAVALTDHLALMREGVIVQAGSLGQLLAEPADSWVSEFLG